MGKGESPAWQLRYTRKVCLPLELSSVPPCLHTKQWETVFLCSGIRIFFKKQIYELRLGKTNVYSLGPLFTNNFPYVLFFCFPNFFKVRCLCDYQAAPKGLGLMENSY